MSPFLLLVVGLVLAAAPSAYGIGCFVGEIFSPDIGANVTPVLTEGFAYCAAANGLASIPGIIQVNSDAWFGVQADSTGAAPACQVALAAFVVEATAQASALGAGLVLLAQYCCTTEGCNDPANGITNMPPDAPASALSPPPPPPPPSPPASAPPLPPRPAVGALPPPPKAATPPSPPAGATVSCWVGQVLSPDLTHISVTPVTLPGFSYCAASYGVALLGTFAINITGYFGVAINATTGFEATCDQALGAYLQAAISGAAAEGAVLTLKGQYCCTTQLCNSPSSAVVSSPPSAVVSSPPPVVASSPPPALVSSPPPAAKKSPPPSKRSPPLKKHSPPPKVKPCPPKNKYSGRKMV